MGVIGRIPMPPKEVTAEVRGSIYVARALELKDGGNNLTVTATDKVGVIQPWA